MDATRDEEVGYRVGQATDWTAKSGAGTKRGGRSRRNRNRNSLTLPSARSSSPALCSIVCAVVAKCVANRTRSGNLIASPWRKPRIQDLHRPLGRHAHHPRKLFLRLCCLRNHYLFIDTQQRSKLRRARRVAKPPRIPPHHILRAKPKLRRHQEGVHRTVWRRRHLRVIMLPTHPTRWNNPHHPS